MRDKRLYILVFFLVIVVRGFGQQDPQFTQHMHTILPINPGIAGSSNICASMHYRQQWAGFYDMDTNGIDKYKTSPEEIMLTVHGKVKPLHGGLGLTVYRDKYGHQQDITVKLAYSFRVNLFGGVLGVGPSIDMLSRKMTKDHWIAGQSGDQVLIAAMGETDMLMSASLGAYFEMQNKWYAGVSSTQLVPILKGNKLYQRETPHLYFLGGYTFALASNPNWEFKPCALVKTDLRTVPQIDATMLAEWMGMYWLGVSYRVFDAVAVLGGAKPFVNASSKALQGLEVMMSYDVTTSQMLRKKGTFAGRSMGSYEFSLKYCFKIVTKPPTEAYRNSRTLGNTPIDFRR